MLTAQLSFLKEFAAVELLVDADAPGDSGENSI
jgi:hypothetical protein